MSVFWSLCTYQLVCLSVCLKPLHSSYTCMSVCMCWPVCTYQLVCRSLYPTSSLFLMHLYVSVLASLCAPIRLCVCVSRLIHLYVCVVVSLYVSIGLSFCLSHLRCIPHARVCLCVGHSVLITWSVSLSVSSLGPVSCTCMSVCWLLCTYQLVCLSVCLSVTRPLHSSRTCMSVRLPVCTRRYVITARVPGTTRRWVTNASWRPTMTVPFMTSPRPTNGSASCSHVSLDTC